MLIRNRPFKERAATHENFLGAKSLCLPKLILLGVLTCTSVPCVRAQTPPTAMAVVQRAIAALGGEQEWTNVGAMVASAQIEHAGKPAVPSTVSSDWSTGKLLYKSEVDDSSGMRITIPSSQKTLASSLNRTTHLPFHEPAPDIVTVPYLPAVVLMRALREPLCSFSVIDPQSGPATLESTVLQACSNQATSTGGLQLLWRFSQSSARPVSVEYAAGAMTGSPARAIVHYLGYASKGALAYPASVQIDGVGVLPKHIAIEQSEFFPSLPLAQFE